jgi:hypothetical protein
MTRPSNHVLATVAISVAILIGFVDFGLSQEKADDLKPAPKKAAPNAASFAPPKKEYAQEFHQSLKSPKKLAGWLEKGDGAEDCVHWEAAGLRLALPTGWPGQRPSTGLRTTFGAKGDFEATADFEMLKEQARVPEGMPTRLSIEVFDVRAKRGQVSMSRSTGKNGGIFVAWSSQWNDQKDKMEPVSKVIATKAKTGKLRVVRSGPDLYFASAEEEDDFRFFAKHSFSTDNIAEFRIAGSTGNDAAFLDARVTEFRVRADAILNLPAIAEAVAEGAPPAAKANRWLWLLAVGVLLMLTFGIVAWIVSRRRRDTPA